MMKKKMIAVFFLALLTGASGAWAQCSRIRFARGRTSAVINGKVGAQKIAHYCLHAREGQRMTAHLTSTDKRARFYIAPDGYDADFLEGADGVTHWEGDLGSASGNGDFIIAVEASRAGATFTLEVTIR